MATQGRGCKPACLGPGISLTSPGSTSAPSMGSQQPGSRGRGRGTGFSGCDGTMGSLVPLPLPLCTALSPGVPWGKKSVLLGLGAGEPLTLPFGRWQALRAASTRFRSAGNIWKKLEKTKRERPAGQRDRCQPRGELVEVWEGSWGTHFFTGIFPSALSCILSFTRLQGQRAVCQGLGLMHLRHRLRTQGSGLGAYILSRNVMRGALAVSGCLAKVRTSSAQSCRAREHSTQASSDKLSPATSHVPDGGTRPQARCFPQAPCPRSPYRRQSCGR